MVVMIELHQKVGKVLPPPNAKSYDGSTVVSHTVLEGQNLASIASIYRFEHWRPIWLYNSEIQRTIGKNPDIVKKGVTLLIPRNKMGYDNLIRKLHATSDIILADSDGIRASLEGEWYELEAYKVLIDTTADIFKTVSGLALKAVQAAKAADVAMKSAEQARIAAYHAMRSESRLVATDLANLASKRVRTAKVLAAKSGDATAKLTTAIQRKAIGTGAKVADKVLASTGVNESTTYNIGNSYKAKETVRKSINLLSSASKLVDVAEIVLDYVKPSMMADGFVFLSSGESVGMTYDQQRKLVQEAAESVAARIAERASELKKECAIIYS